MLQPGQADVALTALAEQLAAAKVAPLGLVVCGGTAMNALGYVSRATKDVDVVALLTHAESEEASFLMAKPLPPEVLAARDAVAEDLGLDGDWLNDGPADLLRWGLPAGCEQRLQPKRYGQTLTVHFLGRLDLICLKLYAYADSQALRHRSDLLALEATSEELELALEWVLTHDDSEAFQFLLKGALKALGASDVAAKLA